ncbi:hypothetical protein [Aurantiacibacter rhizosphaerae]|uniref:Uncharacterized protein n=1 Tax=Aurantiacibacter rhizosphaerae TaxID=2691582 RepID=A0A844XHJ9_9SPHN|nr:hypothetical protein [Aurantiacibacter rhizosphaerae]MWV29203.1 hypothetical protein [Aurantiacibacter rhizosphaerae]
MIWRHTFLITALALAGCSHTLREGELLAPYAAVMKPVPEGESRIYLLAAIPGTLVFEDDCVLLRRMDGMLVLPVFEAGTTAGADSTGAWLHDPVSGETFRHRARINGGGGSAGETVSQLERRNVLQQRVPTRCREAMQADAVVILNPGLEPAG